MTAKLPHSCYFNHDTVNTLSSPIMDSQPFFKRFFTSMSCVNVRELSIVNASVTTDKDKHEHNQYIHRFNGELYPKRISRRMLMTSFMMAIPAVCSLRYECYFLAIGMWSAMLCSINFWRKPTDGMRRYVDRQTARTAIIVHFLYGVQHVDWDTSVTFAGLIIGCTGLYLLARVANLSGNLDLDSCFHCGMHLWISFWNPWVYQQIYSQRDDTL